MKKKLPWKWIVAAAVLLLIGVSLARVMSARKAEQAALAQPRAEAVVELAPGDIAQAQTLELVQGLALSGSLKAANSAVVKARVAGELQGLTVREGDTVSAGQVIARIDPTEYQARLAQAQQQADSAKSQVDIAQRQFDNNRALVDQGFISRTALDTSQATLAGAQATYRAALAAVDVARKAMDDTVLRAPIAGQIAQRLAQPGERVAIDGRVVEVVDLSRLELEATLSAADSVQVRVGQTAQLKVEGRTEPLAARVVRINPSAQAGSRAVLAYLSLADTTGLRQGLFAEGTLATGTVKALAVPLSAVRTDQPAPYVQVMDQQRLVRKNVTPGVRGRAGDEDVVAVEGLTEGSTVLRGSVGPLREGTALRMAGKP